MNVGPSQYFIRKARVDEVDALRAIEDTAGVLFDGRGLIDPARDVSVPSAHVLACIAEGGVFVVCTPDDCPVGVAIASITDGVVHLDEMDVLPTHGRQGLGARLLEAVCAWAGERGATAVTLSTFRELPWNGPFYARHGFVLLDADQWHPWMHGLRAEEAARGLAVDARVFMARHVR